MKTSSLHPFKSVLYAMLGVFVCLAASQLRAAAPLAGSTIGNQASATYTDASNTSHTVTSNVTLTIIQQVGSLILTADQTRNGAIGGQIVFPHTLTNTGNGSDTFALSIAQLAGDNFDLTNTAAYADANGDGLPDNSTPITSTGLMAAGANFKFVVIGSIPAGPSAGQSAQSRVTATSTFSPSTNASNVDTAIVSINAVIQVTQSISSNSGASPSGPYTLTLNFNNTGNLAATNVTLMNTLPAGFDYVAGSARWSTSGATALTDASGGDPAGISYDYGITVTGRVTATLASLAAGQAGTLTFQVNVPAGVAPGIISNNASFSYHDGAAIVGPFNTNTVQFTVTQPASVTLTGSTVASANQGSTVSFTNIVTNTGHGTETFEITLSNGTFPNGTTFRLVQPDGATTLLDTNSNGTPDTGPLASGASYNVILRATLPAGATGGPFSITKTATAASNPSVSASDSDILTVISSNTVDLTADAGGTLGVGPGPEGTAVATLAGNPGATVRFTLNVKNNSTSADSFSLASSSTANFSVAGLPSGWTVVYRDAANAIVTQTTLLNASSSQVLYADVTIPASHAAGTQTVYFRAQSPVTGATDILHDAVTINASRQLTLSAGSNAQVHPGGSVVYGHTLTNHGNATEGDGIGSTLALTLDHSSSGWNALVYHDANGNGVIDAGEPVITDTSFTSNGAAGLAPGESVSLLIAVFSPAGAAIGSSNTVTLTATTTNGTNPGTAPAAISASDTTTVILNDIRLLKEQALDANADGIADGAYSAANISTGATPGAGICYRVTATNTGSQPALSVVLTDATPTFTTYNAATPATTSAGSIGSTPANGASGSLIFNLGTLAPGASVVVTFAVIINP